MGSQKLGTYLNIKVTPQARQNKIVGWENGVLKIHVTAPPEKGEANKAVVELLSKALGIAKNRIVLVHGATTRQKQFLLEGINTKDLDKL